MATTKKPAISPPSVAPSAPAATPAPVEPGSIGSAVQYFIGDGDAKTETGNKLEGVERQATVIGVPHESQRDLRVRLLPGDHTDEEVLKNGLIVYGVIVRADKRPGSCTF